MTDFPEYAEINRAHWNRHADWWVAPGRRNWSAAEPSWGVWGISNSELPLLPDDMTGMDAIELGCGTAYVSGWMKSRGARVVGIDPSDRQLETARTLSTEHGAQIEFVHGVAESVPWADASFDFAISEYGAAIWADPRVWIPEAWRLLKPGGHLVFLGNSSWAMVCAPDEGHTSMTMQRDYFGMHKVAWSDEGDPSVEFNLPISEWFALFKQTGFVVEDFYEVRAPDSATGVQFETPAEWAKRYPTEQAWRLRKSTPR
ncbi:MAG: class I SAM-dependent methyltransferase [Gemmatimonadetes bacterium]|jgi:SAM-dependent methyltransferase|nr:class I SAM-dependent methyltransferase [Gemmatimonadota bacterium]MBT4609577.1 class I SAM-dependent methyltransferase [Gemmatimonadota bacterium]MBT5055280.1 class I SAM-dependent methyltransferase [Gemmatimonadota bacterium]MBT5142850.1 class I SAM-dependent methyltransferase [Gemmatimonadota bacterium]MBT5589443.1 class I SAM-dependent methyltransferase [Gemmatimonadota bacterium]